MKKDLKTTLQSNGLRVTKARIAMLSLLEKTQKPLDVETIKVTLRKDKIDADEATIYRFLNKFLEENLVRRVEFQEGKYRFELADRPHHHHAVCTNCGSIVDIEDCDIEYLEKKLKKKSSFVVQNHNLEFFGLCSNCQ